jgi:hypothetical protein
VRPEKRQRGVLLAGEERTVVTAGGERDRASASTPGWNGSLEPDAIRTGIPLRAEAWVITSSRAKSAADANAPALTDRASAYVAQIAGLIAATAAITPRLRSASSSAP